MGNRCNRDLPGRVPIDKWPSDEKELPKNRHGILDRLYSRAIVLDYGASRAALITVDKGAVFDATWRTVTQRVEKELGIPASNALLTATHINVNRNRVDPKTRRWWKEPNYDGPSDKTVAVVKIESLSGPPIAVYYIRRAPHTRGPIWT